MMVHLGPLYEELKDCPGVRNISFSCENMFTPGDIKLLQHGIPARVIMITEWIKFEYEDPEDPDTWNKLKIELTTGLKV